MASQASIKKTRSLRTSNTQYEELVSYMESHSEFAAGKFLTKEGKLHHIKQWEELVVKLNALSGSEKSTKQWQTVWRDLKSNASKKASKLRNERQRTGNFPVTAQPLSTLEQRVIACMGLEYVQGSVNCPDSTPEEEEYQLRLERGETEVLYYAPTTTSIEDVCIDNDVPLTLEENDMFEELEEDGGYAELGNEDVVDICRQNKNIESTSTTNENVAPNLQTIAPSRRRTQEIHRNSRQKSVQDISAAESNTSSSQTTVLNRRRIEKVQRNQKRRQRIGVQLQEARENFSDIAEKHAEALKLFGEASMKMAANDSQRLLLEEKRLEMEEKRIATDQQIQTVLMLLLDKIE